MKDARDSIRNILNFTCWIVCCKVILLWLEPAFMVALECIQKQTVYSKRMYFLSTKLIKAQWGWGDFDKVRGSGVWNFGSGQRLAMESPDGGSWRPNAGGFKNVSRKR